MRRRAPFVFTEQELEQSRRDLAEDAGRARAYVFLSRLHELIEATRNQTEAYEMARETLVGLFEDVNDRLTKAEMR